MKKTECDLLTTYRRLNTAWKEYVQQTVAIAAQAYSEKNDAVSDLETAL